ncbi:Metallo-hydrolase/oxidoreductase [Aureobasidium subglaciale]|nr:Metallo-hydrolase/oxidoreductase [Aureobasidium subglaciale]KAI5231007.1 Metallo-hydrolase/oxidoreductase [Aureobasidium subglaciale]KAI5265189.1 Metallo-hydrolase/oxidoreductase [Aureobasidium subglaciale]
MATKRKLDTATPEPDEPIDPSDELMFLCLGGGNEVGRSCHIIQYKGKTVMLDAGAHPAYDGLASLPFYDEFDLSTVDILLITHFHLDHAASLPYVMAKTNFKGRVFMTHPTKAIYKWLMQDSVRVQSVSLASETLDIWLTFQQPTQLYTEADVLSTLPMIQTIAFHTTHTHAGIRITPYPAGHVLGAAMYVIEIAGLNILFTGDYSREHDRHLIPASAPKGVKVDVLITESTFGVASHIPRVERETALMKSLTGVLNRGGRVLMPVFAIGRAQELLLILEDYWNRHPEYRKYPIYYASNLAKKCMLVYQTYIDAMNDNIKSMFQNRLAQTADGSNGEAGAGGPWDFRWIRNLKSLDRFDDVGGCVMLASPGMLQNGVSRALLERWAPDPKNGVIVTGYSVEGTMAKMILTEPESIQAVMTGRVGGRVQGLGGRGKPGAEGEKVMIPRRCTVQEYSFAAHVDGTENREFIEEVAAPVVILVHGEKTNMMRLKSKLLSLNANKTTPVKVFSPANCEELRIPFKQDKIAKVVGRLANQIQLSAGPPSPPSSDEESATRDEKKFKTTKGDQVVSGVLVQNDFKLSLMAPEDLKEYAGLTTTTILCRQKLTLAAAGLDLIKWALEGTFGAVRTTSSLSESAKEETNGNPAKIEEADEEIERQQETIFEVMSSVRVKVANRGEVEVEWEGNIANDGIADAVLAVLLTVESSPAAVKQSSVPHSHDHHEKKRNLHAHITPSERLSRLCMFLEAQFGEDAITPISRPKLSISEEDDSTTSDDPIAKEKARAHLEMVELERLHKAGIPVPGLEIRVDKTVAKVWLETLEVECGMRSMADRIRAVVERAVEVVAPLWE